MLCVVQVRNLLTLCSLWPVYGHLRTEVSDRVDGVERLAGDRDRCMGERADDIVVGGAPRLIHNRPLFLLVVPI